MSHRLIHPPPHQSGGARHRSPPSPRIRISISDGATSSSTTVVASIPTGSTFNLTYTYDTLNIRWAPPRRVHHQQQQEEVEERTAVISNPAGGGGGNNNNNNNNIRRRDDREEHEANGGGLPPQIIARFLKTRKPISGRDEVCAICLNDLNGRDSINIGVLNCHHEFHVRCICEWLKKKNVCPLCKAVALR